MNRGSIMLPTTTFTARWPAAAHTAVPRSELNHREQHRRHRGDDGADVGHVVEQECEQSPEHGVVDPEQREPQPDRDPGPQARDGLDHEVAFHLLPKVREPVQRVLGIIGHGAELAREARRFEQDEHHGEEDQERVAEHPGRTR